MMRKSIVFLLLIGICMMSPTLMLAQSKNSVLIKNATVMTAVKGTLDSTDILVENGKITKIGKGLTAPAGASTIDATGKYVTPGIIDCTRIRCLTRSMRERTPSPR